MPGGVKVSLADINGRTLCTTDGPSSAGIHRVQWTLVAPLTAGSGRGGRAGGAGADTAGRGGAGGGGGGSAPNADCGGAGAGGRGGNAVANVAPGTYLVKLTASGHAYAKPVQVLEDRWLNER
jgi:hypothetical protein